MPEEKFDPIKEFTNIRDNLSRSLEQSVRGLATNIFPAVDVYETPESVIVRCAAIDGISPESLEVSMENGVLTISGIIANDTDLPANATLISRERKFGQFSRGIRIQRAVKAEAAQASLKRGVLTITIPKIEDKRPQVIDVTPAE